MKNVGYHSWERKLNEGSNGFLRQYFPKGMELTNFSDEKVQRALDSIIHGPRKVLGYRSAYEIFFRVEIRYTKPPV
ncbi:MAG: IS30 family transposase, partial [Phycisphaerae bacterium]